MTDLICNFMIWGFGRGRLPGSTRWRLRGMGAWYQNPPELSTTTAVFGKHVDF